MTLTVNVYARRRGRSTSPRGRRAAEATRCEACAVKPASAACGGGMRPDRVIIIFDRPVYYVIFPSKMLRVWPSTNRLQGAVRLEIRGPRLGSLDVLRCLVRARWPGPEKGVRHESRKYCTIVYGCSSMQTSSIAPVSLAVRSLRTKKRRKLQSCMV